MCWKHGWNAVRSGTRITPASVTTSILGARRSGSSGRRNAKPRSVLLYMMVWTSAMRSYGGILTRASCSGSRAGSCSSWDGRGMRSTRSNVPWELNPSMPRPDVAGITRPTLWQDCVITRRCRGRLGTHKDPHRALRSCFFLIAARFPNLPSSLYILLPGHGGRGGGRWTRTG